MKTIKIILLILFLVPTASTAFCLEALVVKETGAVIVIKPNGSVWGSKETDGSFYAIKNIKDESLVFKDEECPKIIWPYAVYSEPDEFGRRELITESEYKIDPEADDEKALVKDGTHFNKSLSISN